MAPVPVGEAEVTPPLAEEAAPAPAPVYEAAPPARTDAHLRGTLRRIDGRPYPAYNDLLGEFAYPGFTLSVDHVQQDPFAPASRLRVRVALADAGIPGDLLTSPVRRTALADFIVRVGARALRDTLGFDRESYLAVDHGDQEVLQRSSCVVSDDFVEVRLRANLPAEGRSVMGPEADRIFAQALPAFVAALSYESLSHKNIRRHVEDVEDQVALRAELAGRHLVAFVADGSVLPRASGISQKPLAGADVVPFQSPPELRVELSAPNRGKVTGMGIPEGVTVIVGGGFHGKSTLLNAIARGVYDHIPGDGREAVVTRADAFVVRAESGRPVERVDISAFINDLPFAKDTAAFTTDSASGSTSMAANIVEALEAGTGLLLIDEDTSASNFLVRDARMQRLVPDEAEPITPYVDLARALFEEHRVSTIIAIGGSGDYLDVADTVIMMRDYLPKVVTDQARQVARDLPSQRRREGRRRLGPVTRRTVVAGSIDLQRKGRERVRARGRESIEFGAAVIDVSSLSQLVDAGQVRAVADLLSYCWHRRYYEDEAALADALARGLADAARRGLEALSPHGEAGDYAMPRLLEAVAALNRLRGIRVKQIGA